MQQPDSLAYGADQFRLLVDAVTDYAIYLLDRDGIVASWNAGARRIKGYESDEIVGRHFSLFYTEADRAINKPARALHIAATVGRYEEEGWRVRKDGTPLWASVVITAVKSADGELTGFAKVTRDLTERKRTEDALRESHIVLEQRVEERTAELQRVSRQAQLSEVRYRTIVDAMSAVVWSCAPTGANFRSTPAWSMYTGDLGELASGLEWTQRIHPEARQLVRSAFLEALDRQTPFVDSFRVQRADGQYRHVTMRGYPLQDSDGRLLEWVGVMIDITEQRRLQEQLHQSQKMEAVGQLAGGVAHDFNNLLTVISGYSELLLSSMTADDTLRPSVVAISDAGERAAGLTRQLLSFSRQAVLEPRVLNVNDVVRDTELMLRRVIGEDVLLTTVLDPEVSPVRVDPHQLGQILMNLAVNARDALPDGGRLTIETRSIELDEAYVNTHVEVCAGRHVLIAVTDNGTGMSPDVRAKIFEPFFTTKGVGRGTGLGLSVVHGIIRQSNGQIGAYSEPGIGTTIKIYLPEADSPSNVATPRVGTPSVTARGTETILLVEDEAGVRAIALLALESQGYTVIAAEDGADALRILDKHHGPVDMLLTDVVMPGMNGRQLAEHLRVLHPSMHTLFMSGYTDDTVVRHGILQAEVAFLQKPYTPSSLLRKVRQVLDRA